MKIVTRAVKNENTSLAISVFKDVIGNANLNFKSLNICIRNESRSFIINSAAFIILDENDHFIRNSDIKGIRAVIIRHISSLIVRYKLNRKPPPFIDNVLINRESVKRGFCNEISYLCYYKLIGMDKKILNLENFLAANVPWLSFYGEDEYYSNFFRKAVKNFKYNLQLESDTRKLFRIMKKNLYNSGNLNKAADEMRRIYADNKIPVETGKKK